MNTVNFNLIFHFLSKEKGVQWNLAEKKALNFSLKKEIYKPFHKNKKNKNKNHTTLKTKGEG